MRHATVEEDAVTGVGVDRVWVRVLAEPVGVMLTERNPVEDALIPVWLNLRDVGAILSMRIRAVVGRVLTLDDFFTRHAIVAVAGQIAAVVHQEVAVSIVLIRQGDFPECTERQTVGIGICKVDVTAADHRRTIFVPAMVDDASSIVCPHLMADPVVPAPRIATRIPLRIVAFRPNMVEDVLSVVVDIYTADAAVKSGPLMVIHDDIRIERVELHMGDPAERNHLFIEQFSTLRVIHTEVGVQPLVLRPLVNIVLRTLIETIALGIRVEIEDAPIRHRHAQLRAVQTDVRECGHPAIRHAVQHPNVAVPVGPTDFVILNIVDTLTDIVEADAGLAEALILRAIEVNVALQDALLIIRQLPVGSAEHVMHPDIRMSVPVRNQIDTLVIRAE